MPRINIQIVGLIEIDATAASGHVEGSGLWYDLLQVGSGAAVAALDAVTSAQTVCDRPRWQREPEHEAIGSACRVSANLPRLNGELSAELTRLVGRLCAARER